MSKGGGHRADLGLNGDGGANGMKGKRDETENGIIFVIQAFGSALREKVSSVREGRSEGSDKEACGDTHPHLPLSVGLTLIHRSRDPELLACAQARGALIRLSTSRSPSGDATFGAISRSLLQRFSPSSYFLRTSIALFVDVHLIDHLPAGGRTADTSKQDKNLDNNNNSSNSKNAWRRVSLQVLRRRSQTRGGNVLSFLYFCVITGTPLRHVVRDRRAF